MAEKLTKRQLKQDQFLQSVYIAWGYARANLAPTLLGLVGLVAAVMLAVQIGGSAATGTRSQDPEAEQALVAAGNEFAQGRLESGAEALREVKRRHGSTRAGREASYLLGDSLFEMGDYAAAQAAFEEFLKDPLYDDLLIDGARLAIAACKEESGDLPGAAQDYRTLWTSAESPAVRVQAALAAARVARTQGRDADARELYQGIVDAYPQAPEAEDARFALLEIPGS
jgi:TolA-binding protein